MRHHIRLEKLVATFLYLVHVMFTRHCRHTYLDMHIFDDRIVVLGDLFEAS